MASSDYLNDIKEIKHLMNRSSRFISLSGLSGVMAGIYALIGAWFAKQELAKAALNKIDMRTGHYEATTSEVTFNLLLIATIVVVLAIVTGIFLTQRKAKKNNEKMLDKSAIKLLVNFLIPLITGGIFTLVILQRGLVGLVAPTTLIFYGLACVSASKFTYGHVKYLGFSNIILGLIATQYIGYGLYFWAIGFGIFHIVYGTWMYILLEQNTK
ncbi:hypothetical protein [Kordia zhangzhouensis]|uniref:hypothetical protein n=1 Tax=Kordia zhangzhouensis TaxID=1620405 RepID=UPI0006294868|nr:hypothetical protein [Kordia zhangzhouensis]